MSNDPVRVIFADGTILYTVGDACTVQSERLHETPDQAWEAYVDAKWEDRAKLDTYYAPIPAEELDRAKLDEEPVEIETRYGAPGWKEMLTPVCRASKSARLITYGPAYPKHDYGWGAE